jgi:hypothetical protein
LRYIQLEKLKTLFKLNQGFKFLLVEIENVNTKLENPISSFKTFDSLWSKLMKPDDYDMLSLSDNMAVESFLMIMKFL